MAQSVSYTEIEDRILFRADAKFSAPGFTSADERKYLINAYYNQLYNMLVEAFGDEYRAVDASFSTIVGQGSYDLDDQGGGAPYIASTSKPFLRLLSVHIKDGTRVRPVKHWEMRELDYLRQMELNGFASIGAIRYRVVDTKLVLRPAPQQVYSVLCYYVPIPPKLVSAPVLGVPNQSTTLDGVSGFEEWVVLSGAIIIKEKKGADVSTLVAEREKIETAIAKIKADRNAADAPRVVSRGEAHSLSDTPYVYGLGPPWLGGWW